MKRSTTPTIEIIKRLLSSNKGAILLDENELFDYTFNIAIDSYNKSIMAKLTVKH